MRKIIMLLATICVLVLTIEIFINGIGILNINGVNKISNKNKEIDAKIIELDDCVNKEYREALDRLNNTYNLFENDKKDYNEQVVISSLNKNSYATQNERYDLDYLLTKIGKYADDEDVILKTRIEPSEAIEGFYHVNFMVWGTYLYTANFIYDIESDSKLGFKIDNFKMVPYYVDEHKYDEMDEETKLREKMQDEKIDVVCTFTCKDIPIKAITSEDETFLTKKMFEIKTVESQFDSDGESNQNINSNPENLNNNAQNVENVGENNPINNESQGVSSNENINADENQSIN